VLTDTGNIVQSLTDCRQLFFRLGSGGSIPDIYHVYPWAQGRDEVSGLQPFQGGDRAIASLKDWADAVMSRIWELGGGQYWYSETSTGDLKLAFGQPTLLINNDNFYWDGTTLSWSGLSVVFANSSGWYNDIAAGSAALLDGQALYVDVDRTQNLSGANSLVAAVGTLSTLGSPTVPGSRVVIAWRSGAYIYVRDLPYEVGRAQKVASNLAGSAGLGVVRLTVAAGTPLTPTVIPVDANGQLVNDLSVGAGNANAFVGTGRGTGHGLLGYGGATGSGVYGVGPGGGVTGVGQGAGFGVAGYGGFSSGLAGYFEAGTSGIALGVVGRAGIGTLTPIANLHVDNATAECDVMIGSQNASAGLWLSGQPASHKYIRFYDSEVPGVSPGTLRFQIGESADVDDYFYFTNNLPSTPAMVINSADNVGIGMPTPLHAATRLQVVGAAGNSTAIYGRGGTCGVYGTATNTGTDVGVGIYGLSNAGAGLGAGVQGQSGGGCPAIKGTGGDIQCDSTKDFSYSAAVTRYYHIPATEIDHVAGVATLTNLSNTDNPPPGFPSWQVASTDKDISFRAIARIPAGSIITGFKVLVSSVGGGHIGARIQTLTYEGGVSGYTIVDVLPYAELNTVIPGTLGFVWSASTGITSHVVPDEGLVDIFFLVNPLDIAGLTGYIAGVEITYTQTVVKPAV
jgi:hypothetical protein